MTHEEWLNHKDFDELSREMNSPFDERRLSPMEALAQKGSFLTARPSTTGTGIKSGPTTAG